MTGLLIALALAVWSALCTLAGGYYIHHRYTGRIRRLAAYSIPRERQFAAAADLWRAGLVEKARRHTLAVTR